MIPREPFSLITNKLPVLVLLLAGIGNVALAAGDVYSFSLRRQPLDELLRAVAEQAGLQLVFEQNAQLSLRRASLTGRMSVDDALDRALRGSTLQWRFVGERIIAIYPRSSTSTAREVAAPTSAAAKPTTSTLTVLPDINILGTRFSMGDNSMLTGFDKPLAELPRTVSVISGEAAEAFNINAVEDLVRVTPGVFTTTRFGVQGSVDVRNVPGDSYFRGMKRLTLQGHGRSVLAAADSIEVVSGLASPLYGLGKIGGYTNFVPKSGRAKAGQYLQDPQGFVQIVGGSYGRRELSFGLGGALHPALTGQRQGGFYFYGLIEDSDSYAEGVPVRQKLFQLASSVDDVAGHFRLESGINYQLSNTAGALTGRLTQSLVDRGVYLSGSPLVNLDTNNSGAIGYLEMNAASPVSGRLSSNNQPLQQVFAWPVDAQGKLLPLGSFPVVNGIPRNMYDYLVAHPQTDPTGLLRAQGVGGVVPLSGRVPVGMMLDPRSVAYAAFNPRHSTAYEKDLQASFLTLYADLIDDADPNHSIKNQLFYDGMNQYKSSNQPFSQIQNVYVIEDKFTLSHRPARVPAWMRLNTLVSVNARNTMSRGKRTLADYGNHRTDAAAPDWNADTVGMTPNTTFTSSNESTSLVNDGLPWRDLYRTEFSEYGIGALFDADIKSTNVVVGARYDWSHASNKLYAGSFNINTGTATSPGAYSTADDVAAGRDGGATWSISVAQKIAHGVMAYANYERATIMLDGNNNSLTNAVIRSGHVGEAEMREAGVKVVAPNGRMVWNSSAYQQGRLNVSPTDMADIINAYASATTTRGWQSEIRWMISERFMMGMYALRQITRYTPNVGGLMQVDARSLGFKDVVDATGRVVYPAEAFLYGGRAFLSLPNDQDAYVRKQGNPEKQAGVTLVYYPTARLGITASGNYLSSTCSGRLCLVKLPQSRVFNVGIDYQRKPFGFKLDISNLTDERYFRARTGDTLGDVIAQTMPGRSWQLTGKYSF